MPYSIRKLPNQDLYRVYNKQTKAIHSYSTTLENAKKQVNLLLGKEEQKEGKGGGQSVQRPRTPPIDYTEEVAREALAKAAAEEQQETIARDAAEEKRLKKKGKGTGTSRVAPETETLGVVANSPEAIQKQLRRSIFRVKGKITNLTEERQVIFINFKVPDKAALMRLRLKNLNDNELKEGIEEVIDINKQLVTLNGRLERLERELANSLSGKVGGNIEEDGQLLKPFFNRIGSKVPIIRNIVDIIPPHTTYVEAFVGGGALFWNKIPAKKSVINDLDKELIEGYKILKRIPVSADMTILDNSKKVGKKYPAVEKFIEGVTSKSSDRDKLLAFTEKYSGTFGSSGKGGVYKNFSIETKWNNIDQYKAILKPTTIVSKDYLQVLKQYDSPTTFFFLDPPYEVEKKGQETYYKNSVIDYEKMRDALKQIKGKFLLTINNNKNIRDIFKDFNQKSLVVRNQSNSGISKEMVNRKELFITNYTPSAKAGGSIETDKFEEDGVVSLPKFRSVKINLPTYMYKKLPDINGKPPPYKYRLVVPITSSRNISSRKQETSLDISQKPVSKPNVVIDANDDPPNIDDFSPADKVKIQNYYAKVTENERKNPDEIDKDDYEIKQRGKPLPCRNAPCKEKQVATKKTIAPPSRVATMVAAIEKPKSKSFVLTDEQLADLALNDDDAFEMYNNDLEEFKKKYKGKYGKKYGFGVGKPVSPTTPSNLGQVEQNKISAKSNMANSWITYVKAYAAKNGMSYRDALRDPECKAGYKKEGSKKVTPVVKKGKGVIDEIGNEPLVAMSYNDSELGATAGRKFISL